MKKGRTVFLALVALILVTFISMNLQLLPLPRMTLPSMTLLSERYRWDPDAAPDPRQKCQIPQPDPWDKSILQFVTEAPVIHCRRVQSELTYIDSQHVLRFNQTTIKNEGYDIDSLNCKYQEIIRPEGNDDDVKYGSEKELGADGAKLPQVDWLSVRCKNWFGWPIYAKLHAHPRRLVRQNRLLPSSYSSPSTSEDRRPINILAFGVDSMSRLNFMRQLPVTYEYLTHRMDSVILHGLTRVGDNTYPNIMAMFLGWKTNEGPFKRQSIGVHFDSWPYIWKNFSAAGYTTLLAEDQPQFNVFNYLMSGFFHQPTDHYLRPFYLAMEDQSTHKLSSHLCYGSTPKHMLLINYVRDFITSRDDDGRRRPYFAFSFLTEISHNLLNTVGAADEDFASFLRTLHEGGYFNDTILFFFGDHGHRIDPIRLTPIGRIEGSMPFCAVYLPPRIRRTHPQVVATLHTNSRRLTAMYDFHSTFLDVLQYSTSGVALGSPLPTNSSLGSSLFNEISLNRTCADAGIADQYCMCEAMSEEELDEQDENAKGAAQSVVDAINALTESHRGICAALRLGTIRSAHRIKGHGTKKFRIVVETTPGKGIFEGFVHLDADGRLRITNEPIRINEYKGQEKCVTPAMMRLNDLRNYCYCLS